MELSELYAFADSHKIDIDMFPMSSLKAVCLPRNDHCAIGVDKRKMRDEAELKTTIAHELGHCETGTFYTAPTYLELRSRYEYRADKWAVKMLIPQTELESALKCGESELWQLAEHFGVEEELVEKALYMYFDITPVRACSL